MSEDVRFLSIVDDLQVVEITELEGAVPRTLRVFGRGGFNSAQRVLINDFGVDDFTRVSDTVLLVRPGSVFENVAVFQMIIAVVSGELTGTRKVRLLFGPTKSLRQASGLQKLVQQFVKLLLSNVGSNKFSRLQGGGLLQGLGETLDPSGKTRVSALLARAVTATEQQVIAAQSGGRNFQADERLLSATLSDVSFLVDLQEVRATIRFVTYAGRSLELPLTL